MFSTVAFESQKKGKLAGLQEAIDKSPKNSLDAPIVDLIHFVNKQPDYVTTSSCSGRVVLYHQKDTIEKKGGVNDWLLCEHSTVTMEQIRDSLTPIPSDGIVFLKNEPFVMHVMCKDAYTAQMLLRVALECGFRESGLVLGRKKIMCAIRTTANVLSMPVVASGKLLCDWSALEFSVTLANDLFRSNAERTEAFFKAVVKHCNHNTTSGITTLENNRRKFDLNSIDLDSIANDDTHLDSSSIKKVNIDKKNIDMKSITNVNCNKNKNKTIDCPSWLPVSILNNDENNETAKNTQRWGHSMTSISEDSVIIFGGQGSISGNKKLNDVIVLSVSTNDGHDKRWNESNLKNVINNKNNNNKNNHLGNKNEISISMSKKKNINGLKPLPRIFHTATSIGSFKDVNVNYTVIFGGRRSPSHQGAFNDVHILCTTKITKMKNTEFAFEWIQPNVYVISSQHE
eukprot:GSMAST32.ASY1.ANO1.721.1 assembled CDS